MSFKKVTHVIFDMDGLLLDTEDLYTESHNEIANRYGKTFTWDLKAKIMGFHTSEVCNAIIEALDLPLTPEEFQREFVEIQKRLFPGAKLLPGVEKLLKHLKRHKVPMALATSSSLESFLLKTTNWRETFEMFDLKVLGSSDPEVKRGKPHPDIFLVAARRFPDKPDPSKCLVFEDSSNGIEAALAAGMQAVMVPHPEFPRSMIPKNSTLVIESMEDFKPEDFGLPAFDSA